MQNYFIVKLGEILQQNALKSTKNSHSLHVVDVVVVVSNSRYFVKTLNVLSPNEELRNSVETIWMFMFYCTKFQCFFAYDAFVMCCAVFYTDDIIVWMEKWIEAKREREHMAFRLCKRYIKIFWATFGNEHFNFITKLKSVNLKAL